MSRIPEPGETVVCGCPRGYSCPLCFEGDEEDVIEAPADEVARLRAQRDQLLEALETAGRILGDDGNPAAGDEFLALARRIREGT